jgi:hypothetical protein
MAARATVYADLDLALLWRDIRHLRSVPYNKYASASRICRLLRDWNIPTLVLGRPKAARSNRYYLRRQINHLRKLKAFCSYLGQSGRERIFFKEGGTSGVIIYSTNCKPSEPFGHFLRLWKIVLMVGGREPKVALTALNGKTLCKSAALEPI